MTTIFTAPPETTSEPIEAGVTTPFVTLAPVISSVPVVTLTVPFAAHPGRESVPPPIVPMPIEPFDVRTSG